MKITPGTKFKSIDDYFAAFPAGTKAILKELRKTIKTAAPAAEEVISYNMPALKQNGILVYYAAYKAHIGFYPTPSAIEAFKKELSKYESSKGAVRFPLDQPLPLSLITRIVKFRVKLNREKAGMD